MTDLERIQLIEDILGYKLKQVAPGRMAQKDFYANNAFAYFFYIANLLNFPIKVPAVTA